jgi:flavodoxin I
VAVFFGTSTGNTEDVASLICAKYGCAGPFPIDEHEGSLAGDFGKYDGLIVGTPTWNTGADSERSGTAWDELYYGEMGKLELGGKHVAVFGLGDSEGYAANYADASGELFEVFEKRGAAMFGGTDADDSYVHTASKAQRGGRFVGLMCDQMNQEELSEGRVEKWVKELKAAGFGEGGAAPAGKAAPAAAKPAAEKPAAAKPKPEPAAAAAKGGGRIKGWTAYRSDEKRSTMYVNPENGREAYYVQDK